VLVWLGYAASRAVVEFHEGQYNPRREATTPVPYSRYSGCADFEFLSNFKKRVQQKEEHLTSLFEYSTT
jgi:hypothetical protein